MPIDEKGRFISAEVKPLKERFDEKISFEDGCWIWTGYKNKQYGYVHTGLKDEKKPRAAYRVAWELYKGSIPEGLVVRHRCPKKRKDCCNPDHLKLGTQKDNMADAIEDGTISRGEKIHSSKLKEIQVRDILEHFPMTKGLNWIYFKEKAKEYGVGVQTVADICLRKTWTHIQL
jgi:hypothetical protein